ncbi:Thiol:disulfide interchange protein dsbA [Roseomonas mucosa]|uniref:DsbA family protein n=1 Tax=Roseomonas TaxID=125216 RepID=UPI000C1A1DAD|nr:MULTISPECIES: thioredoxin domain-containing protein [Roseomonas]ATR22640.1 disulfide bond formation protein DsbA [Roseomonas sp. FDAARGOS_362]UZO98607.1 Thiol:disulfide interchange protein dsbA [Roseomonas mucosa]
MTISRRGMLAATAIGIPLGTPALLALRPAHAQTPAPAGAPANTAPATPDLRMAERGAGKADAPVTVIEYFSLTCPHCARFHNEVWPKVKADLVEPGKARMVWRDFPLDQLALAAACAARALPVDRYEGFVSALFANQDRWAFARGIDNLGEVAKIAALAGMSRADFDAAVNDRNLQRAIMEMRQQGEKEFNVNSTPTFVFNGKSVPGEIPFERFAELVKQATPG